MRKKSEWFLKKRNKKFNLLGQKQVIATQSTRIKLEWLELSIRILNANNGGEVFGQKFRPSLVIMTQFILN